MKSYFLFIVFLIRISSASHAQVWNNAEELADSFMLQSRYDSALYYAEEAAAQIRGSSGESGIPFLKALNRLARVQFCLGNYTRSKYYLEKEIKIRGITHEDNTHEMIDAMEYVAIVCVRMAHYEEAYEWIRKAERLAPKYYSEKSSEYAGILSAYGGVYNNLGEATNDLVYIKKAGDLFARANSILLASGETSWSNFIVNRTNQALFENNIGNSPMAEFIFTEVKNACLTKYGQSGQDYSYALNNLGVCFYNNGLFKQAEKYFIDAVDICKKNTWANSIQSAICINNLGALYFDMGNYDASQRLINEAVKIWESFNLQGSPEYSLLLNNLASTRLSKEYYSSSADKESIQLKNTGSIIFQADSIFSLNCQMPSVGGFTIKNNLSLWFKLMGDTARSLKLMQEITSESNFSLKVISVINKMNWSGFLPRVNGDQPAGRLYPLMINIKIGITEHLVDDKGLEQNEQNQLASTRFIINMVVGKANNIKEALGPYHPGYAAMLKSLIPIYKSIGSSKTEEEMMLQYIHVINHNTLQNFTFLSDHERELYYQTRLPEWHYFMNYTLTRKTKNPSITGNAYNQVLLTKGLMLKSSTAMRVAIQSSHDSALLGKYDEWMALQKEISVLYATPVEMRAKEVGKLESRANELEKFLVQSSQTFNDYRKDLQVDWKMVRKNLKQDEAAIEFTHFGTMKKSGGREVIYCALILRNNSENPEMIQLFNESDLVKILGQGEENNSEYVNRLYGTLKQPDSTLYKLIWKPLERSLQGIKQIIVSPSGMLYKVSFAALCNGKSIFLCDKYRLYMKGNTGSRVDENLFTDNTQLSALLFGGIDYGVDASGLQIWNYLSGTKEEGRVIRDILLKVNLKTELLTGQQATETYLKKNGAGFNLIHIATHGFFFPDPDDFAYGREIEQKEEKLVSFRGKARGMGVESFMNNANPLMRSGLVFARANDVWNKQSVNEMDDGVLTAQEVTQLDMRNDFLVVLSACETGLGDILGNEGVYGLQRAFKMAGVKYIISSLWEVPDRETVEFMQGFYAHLLETKEIHQAFSKTQEELRGKYDPYSWGAFVLME